MAVSSLGDEHSTPAPDVTCADAKHVLVIHEKGIDWSIIHPSDCPTSAWVSGLPGDGPIVAYDCAVGVTVGDVGLLDLDWEDLEPGRYEIEFWSERHPAIPGLTVEEWSAGIRIVERTS